MSIRCLAIGVLGALLLPIGVHAQVYNVPTPAPSISAASREWFVDRQPILFTGDVYYPAGPRYHFDPNVMVQTGVYDGIPLYADTSIGAYEEVLVPVGGGLVQPYQRRRTGELAGTTGSHAPDFPVDVVPWETGSASVLPPPAGQYRQPPAGEELPPRYLSPEEEEARLRLLQPPGRIQTILVPADNRGIWIRYEGQRWNAAGKAVAHDPNRFSKIGEYFGFPVFSSPGTEEIYIPAFDGMLAGYQKEKR